MVDTGFGLIAGDGPLAITKCINLINQPNHIKNQSFKLICPGNLIKMVSLVVHTEFHMNNLAPSSSKQAKEMFYSQNTWRKLRTNGTPDTEQFGLLN